MKITLLSSFVLMFSFNLGLAQNDVIHDISFGVNGIVNAPNLSQITDEFAAIAIQTDGKLLTYGRTQPIYSPYPVENYKLARYNTDGSLDTFFGNGGYINITSGCGGYYSTYPAKNQIKIQPDGKILVARMIDVNPHPNIEGYKMLIDRFNTDGSIDTTYGNNGEVTLDDYPGWNFATLIEILPDNKMLICGSANLDIFIVRLNYDGSKDTSFGIDGTFRENYIIFDGVTYFDSFIYSLKMLSDGKILVGGTSRPHGGNNSPDIGLMRLNANGTFDTTFGTGGRLVYNSGVDDHFCSLLLTSNNKITIFFNSALFYSTTVVPTPKIMRLNSNGSFDTDFGDNGILIPTTGDINVQGFNAAILDTYKRYVCLTSNYHNQSILRYNENFSVDTIFDQNGYFPVTGENLTYLVEQHDGKILYGGPEMGRIICDTTPPEPSPDSENEFMKNKFLPAPIPFNDSLTLNFNFETPQKISANFFDSYGRKVQDLLQEQTYPSGDNSIEIRMPESLPKGLYFIKISNGSKNTTLKIIK